MESSSGFNILGWNVRLALGILDFGPCLEILSRM